MKQFRFLFLIGCVALTVTCAMIISTAVHPKTVDFSGRIISLEEHDNRVISIRAEAMTGGEHILIVNEKSRLLDCCGKNISAEGLTPGSIIQAEYKRSIFRKDDTNVIKRLIFYKNSEFSANS